MLITAVGTAVGALAIAAMIYVVVDELLPECLARGNERVATLALLAGFHLMMGLDAWVGGGADASPAAQRDPRALSAHDDDRAARVQRALVAHRAQEQALEAPLPTRPDDE